MRNLIQKYRSGVLQGKAIRGRLACVMAGAALAGALCAYGQISSVAATQTGKATSSNWMIKSVDGDGYTDDAVREVDYSLDDSRIVGYASVPDQALYTLTYTGEDYAVTVTYGEDAMLPEDVELVATEYAQDSEVWQTRYAEAATLYNWNTDHSDDVRLFNVGLYEDGTEVEPQAEVSVLIAYSGKDGLTNYTVTHFGEQTETITAKSDYEDGAQTVRFDVNSFSDIMVSVAEETATEEGEPGDPEALQELVDSGYFDYWSSVIAEQEDTEDQIILPAKSTFSLRSAIASLLGITSNLPSSSQQIVESGGENSNAEDGVIVSKNIAGTDIENVFDITLNVKTTTNISELYQDPDMAVVIVMDISNTMTRTYGSTTRYEAAMSAAENFIDQFTDETNGVSQVGFVAFNTDAHEIFDMKSCSSTSEAVNLKNAMRIGTGAIINASGYSGSTSRFTNIEAGLKMASDMLDSASNENKYIVFLSDGFPTTYMKDSSSTTNYSGWNPYMDPTYNSEYGSLDITAGADGYFCYMDTNTPCTLGTSYSDKAAIRAREIATKIKNNGTTIFSIGVAIGEQTISGFETRVVDTLTSDYEIGSADDAKAFKNWLKNSIGSGYYHDSNDESALTLAFDEILQQIREINEASAQANWVASDPIPTFTGSSDTTVEFLGFYNNCNSSDASTLQVCPDIYSLTGNNVEGGENSASYLANSSSISWDLKKSGYTKSTSGSTTTYTYTITYRVRLQNESSAFVVNTSYATNGDASLTYQVVTTTGGTTTVSEEKTLDFPVPEVNGYLGELTFTKVRQNGGTLEGASFTLSHDTSTCITCRGDGETRVALNDMTATSNENGTVSFENIPSGHTYTLTETTVPTGYSASNKTYSVTVAYGVVTVTENETTSDGTVIITWSDTDDNKIVNYSTPTVEKKVQDDNGDWVDKNTASIGDTVQFKTTIKNASGANYLVLHDKLSTGLNNPYVMYVAIVDSSGLTTYLTNTDYTVTCYTGEFATPDATTTDDCSFEITFTDSVLATMDASDVITVRYRAVLTTDAVIADEGNPNDTYISYGTNSTSEIDRTVTYTYEVNVHKYYENENLSGAEFILYKTETVSLGESEVKYEVTKYAKASANYVLTGWTEERSDATAFTSDSDGKIGIQGLGPGIYYLEETKAPDGYNLLSDPVEITVGSDGTVSYTVTIDNVATTGTDTIEVENKPGYELPKTGGLGTLYFIPAGLLLSGAALTLWHGKHR